MKDIFNFLEKKESFFSFTSLRISLASPEKIKEWSHGEIKKPETINYRTFKPERDGLFCSKIFGPVKDYECNCGKYKRMKHRGVVCEKCGVEVIQSKVRRERLGHICLATPVAHVWFLRSLPSRIGNLLDIPLKSLEKVLYCEAYIVTDAKETTLQNGEILSEERYEQLLQEYGVNQFKAGKGGEALLQILKQVDVHHLTESLRQDMVDATSESKRRKILKRLKVASDLRQSGNRPEWMMLTILPVLPPDLRPLVHLDGGRFATSDLNDLYRRVINRNNRLKRLKELAAPDIIINNEKRMVQEGVDALIDNGKRGKSITGSNKRPLKSLSDILRGKQGRFRQNLLGKRVDYSGRSVIVVGPNLKLHQCGLPKQMALELYKPFVYHKLEKHGYVSTIKAAKRMVERERPEVWDILEEVIAEHPVLLNRAPTLHRLGIQAFEPLLVEGKAIQLHPLVCGAFNADFDGDQMAVHVPLSLEAQTEARVLMMSTNNILSPASGKPIINPTQDIVLGIYYATRQREFSQGCYRVSNHSLSQVSCYGLRGVYSSVEEVCVAYHHDRVSLHAGVLVRVWNEKKQVLNLIPTTVGRCLVAEMLPVSLPFDLINKTLDKKSLSLLIDFCYRKYGGKETVLLVDRLRGFGFDFATKAGISICMDDMLIPDSKPSLLKEGQLEVQQVTDQYQEGLITDGERYNKVVDIWARVGDEVTQKMMDCISQEKIIDIETGQESLVPSFNSIYIMADSGARGSAQQIRQLAGMRGLMARPSGAIIETPITANFREGLSVLQYFISTHGARKGLADTALKTANSGYLTRRLVDVAHDTVVSEIDCGSINGIKIAGLQGAGEIVQPLGDRILGRVVLDDVTDPVTGSMIVVGGTQLDENLVHLLEEAGIEEITIRSVLTCQTKQGVCSKCYGRDLARGHSVNIGEAVGIVAAQSIGEPGTQLTMRTFHIGGTADRGKVTQSFLESHYEGIIQLQNVNLAVKKNGACVIMNRHGEVIVVDETGRERERHRLAYGAVLKVKEGEKIKEGCLLSEWDAFAVPILTETSGVVRFGDVVEGVNMIEKFDEATGLSRKIIVESRVVDLRPRVSIKNLQTGITQKLNNSLLDARYLLPVGANLIVQDGDWIDAGDMIAKIPRETAKTQDITGGLPRIAELFEARKPKDHAIISEIDGEIAFGKDMKGKRKVLVVPFGKDGERLTCDACEYLIPKGKHVQVQEGDVVHSGDPLMDGPANPHDILRIKGEKDLAFYLVNEIQQVYRLQGVTINDKHIEVIVRQMLRRIRIKSAGDTSFLINEQVDRSIFEEVNKEVMRNNRVPALAEPLLLGITKSCLSTDSFLSASSFQETTKVLAEAAVSGKIDRLQGLKENILMGRLVPAGTGLDVYRSMQLSSPAIGKK